MRVYIPATFDSLGELDRTDQVTVQGGWVFAVTPALKEFYSLSDEEEISHVAFQDAARASIRLLADGAAAFPHRRVVISADVDDARLSEHLEAGESVMSVEPSMVDFTDIVALFVDIAASEEATAKAMDVVDAADMDDEDAELIVGDALDNFLAWYAPQELGLLVASTEE